jgi:glycosyltransferase involved in cell wall biosynthesis
MWPGIATPEGGEAVEQPLLPGYARVVGLRGQTAIGDRTLQAGFVSTYVPRQCGIATFTRDLLAGMLEAVDDDGAGDGRGGINAHVAALHADDGELAYPPEVRVVVDAGDPAAYRAAARVLDERVEVVSLQHEFGIFGGEDGRHLLTLLRALDAPVVTTFHTVLPEPTSGQRMVVDELARRSSALVVLSERSRQTMADRYGIPPASIAVIPHGVPDLPFIDPARVKDRFDLAGRAVVLGFGLLGPNKRFELVIEALAQIVDRLPQSMFVIVGATHPELRRREGERYRTMLQERVRRLGLEDHVRFVDTYVDQADLLDWLLASDVFVTPYGSAQQAVSGTLAYALAAGKAIVSTPYDYAQELLADGRGLLTPFDDVGALADALALLLGDRSVRDGMRRRAWEHARAMVWRQVGAHHLALLRSAADQGAVDGAVDDEDAWMTLPRRPHLDAQSATDPLASPPVRRHLGRLSDDLGVAQHAVGSEPDLRHGYCTDDVARALVADLLHAEQEDGPALARSIRRHLAFLEEALEPGRGRFRNFRSEDGEWLEAMGSEDSHGRAVAALGETVLRASDRAVRSSANELLAAALPACLDLQHPRPWAYAALGCVAVLEARGAMPVAAEARRVVGELGERLMGAFSPGRSDVSWPWPEDTVTYDNAVLPRALLEAGQLLGRRPWVERGATVLRWLDRAQTAPAGHFRPVGNRGWWPRGGRPAQWDQQPIEALSMLEAALAAEVATGDVAFGDLAERAYAWFTGANDLGLPVADPAEGACHDGLGSGGLNPNQGAESTLAWLVGVERMRARRAVARTGPAVVAARALGTPVGSRAAQ